VEAAQYKTIAVRRPEKAADLFGLEIGDLVASRAVQGLDPEVIHPVVANDLRDGFAIRRKLYFDLDGLMTLFLPVNPSATVCAALG
jgi:hypothetical protein